MTTPTPGPPTPDSDDPYGIDVPWSELVRHINTLQDRINRWLAALARGTK